MSLADIGGHWRTFLADFLADCPRVDGGPDRIRSDPPRTLADFLSPHKVRLGPPESAKRKSSADTGADSSGQWRTQADPIGSAADSGGQLSASIKPGLGPPLIAILSLVSRSSGIGQRNSGNGSLAMR